MLLEGKEPYDALIWNYMPSPHDKPETTDFGIIGLDKQNWNIIKGKRIDRLYLTPKELEDPIERENEIQYTVVRDVYTYTLDGIIITDYTRHVEFLDRYGDIIYRKDVSTDLYYGQLTRLNKEVRENQINVLRELGAGTPAEAYVDMILVHYATQIAEYEKLGSSSLYDALQIETDPTILAILNTVVDVNPLYDTVKKAIEYQITP